MPTQEFVKVTAGERRSLTSSIPPDMLGKASQRLGLAALVYAFAYVPAFTARAVLDRSQEMPPVAFVLAGVFVVGSVLMFALTRWVSIGPLAILDMGLLYEVVAAAGIEIPLIFWWSPEFATANGISWTCVWIVFFPMLVPATPGKAAMAALAAASMRPLMFLVMAARGLPLPEASVILQFVIPNYICVGVAVITAVHVYRLSTQLGQERRMGSYQLVELLGEGGMGEVWRAEHQLLARPAAVKLIRPEALGAGRSGPQGNIVRRFEREARATASLSSPHTIQLHDFGVVDDGTFYYVMELLRGLNLEEFAERFGPMPPARVAYVLQQACESLGEAHERGMIHRDVKPANVYLCRVGRAHDFVKVLDFGLVKSTAASGQLETALTAQNVAAGTPAFMAPEMALGTANLDGRADIYALGCVGYWLLTGKYVFETRNPVRLVFAHANEEPERPSRRSEIVIPERFEELIMSCLDKRPENRPQNTDEMAQLLGDAVEGSPWTRERAAEWWRSHLPELA